MKLHVHGWKRIQGIKKKLFICCTAPSCYISREWQHVVNRDATCPECDAQFVVLDYQTKHQTLLCHECGGHRLTMKERHLITKFEREEVKIEYEIRYKVDVPYVEIEQTAEVPVKKKVDAPVPLQIDPVLEKELQEELKPEEEIVVIPEIDIVPTPPPPSPPSPIEETPTTRVLTPEEEERLKIALEKKLRNLI